MKPNRKEFHSRGVKRIYAKIRKRNIKPTTGVHEMTTQSIHKSLQF